MVLMILGAFPFCIQTVAHQSLQRGTSYKWAQQDHLNVTIQQGMTAGGPGYQYMGRGEDSITLQGSVFPQYTGTTMDSALKAEAPGGLGVTASISILKVQADMGVSWHLMDWSGLVYGRWIIERIDETDTLYDHYGLPRKKDFTLALKRYSNEMRRF